MTTLTRRDMLTSVTVGGLAVAMAEANPAPPPAGLDARVADLEARVTALETTAAATRLDLETRLAASQAEVSAIRAQVYSGVQLLQAILGMTP